jgi:hypothetical protein
MVFDVAELDGAAMIYRTNRKMKSYLLVLNISNCYEVLYGAHPVFIDAGFSNLYILIYLFFINLSSCDLF